MASKKKPSIDEALNIFKDVMQRASLSNYVHYNSKLVSENNKGNSILIIPESELWLKILEDNDIKEHLKELDISDVKEREKLSLYQYMEDIDDNTVWFNIDIDELFKGKIIRIKVSDNHEYDIPINKNILPLKLKKSEFNEISYRVFRNKNIILALKKKFIYNGIPNSNFTIIKLFKVI